MSLLSLLPHRGASRARLSLLPRLCLIAAGLACSGVSLVAQNAPASPAGDASGMDDRRARRAQNAPKGGATPEEIQERLLGRLREQMGVTDDDEWKVIADRIAKVAELRRDMMGGSAAAMQARFGKNGGTRGGRGSSPELEMLRQALMDNLPDAEIKARLMRLQEVRKMNDERLRQAQEDLRSILTVRQEAIVVLYGLIP